MIQLRGRFKGSPALDDGVHALDSSKGAHLDSGRHTWLRGSPLRLRTLLFVAFGLLVVLGVFLTLPSNRVADELPVEVAPTPEQYIEPDLNKVAWRVRPKRFDDDEQVSRELEVHHEGLPDDDLAKGHNGGKEDAATGEDELIEEFVDVDQDAVKRKVKKKVKAKPPTDYEKEQESAVRALLLRLLPVDVSKQIKVQVRGGATDREDRVRRVREALVMDSTMSEEQVDATRAKAIDSFRVWSQTTPTRMVVVRGTSGVAAASGVYWYLRNYCNVHVGWNGNQVRSLPLRLPSFEGVIEKSSPWLVRHYLNHVTFSYSCVWWTWERWEQEIDWAAMHGINLPLAFTGTEAVWERVYRRMGLTDSELSHYVAGPAYHAWQRMGNLHGWPATHANQTPKRWIDLQLELAQRIVSRMREFGMISVLPAFSGHVPAALSRVFPSVKFTKGAAWMGTELGKVLDPDDPMFAVIGSEFISELGVVFNGTDHFFACDTFNENQPHTDDPKLLARLSEQVFGAMNGADGNQAVWVMQGWLFVQMKKFWQRPQVEGLLSGVPLGRMLCLDLWAELDPVYDSDRVNAFFGQPWVWNHLGNFGGNSGMRGDLRSLSIGPQGARGKGNLVGIGIVPEAIETNPIVYELMSEHTWTDKPIDLDKWMPKFLNQRYGMTEIVDDAVREQVHEVWRLVEKSLYTCGWGPMAASSIVSARPSYAQKPPILCDHRDANMYSKAWLKFVNAASKLPDQVTSSRPFRFDLLDLTLEVFSDMLKRMYLDFVNLSKESTDKESTVILEIIRDNFIDIVARLDRVCTSHDQFLFGPWLEQARSWGETDEEKQTLEINARLQVSLWGHASPYNSLHDYGDRMRSGLISQLYAKRWKHFFDEVIVETLADPQERDRSFDQRFTDWDLKFNLEWATTSSTIDGGQYVKNVPRQSVDEVTQALNRYRDELRGFYPNSGF